MSDRVVTFKKSAKYSGSIGRRRMETFNLQLTTLNLHFKSFWIIPLYDIFGGMNNTCTDVRFFLPDQEMIWGLVNC